ncbi:NAD-dependent protein deacetylase sirtuin-3, mitochondrial isoform X6 [Hemitrygon akajei]|uniref:NAD-dependent protein deacetylase sirtuin-3, mitochondrial isoform X6 n=1 Tax=Hemitrygon akajei TaxID=2704970 RepID=UPI003BFA0F13
MRSRRTHWGDFCECCLSPTPRVSPDEGSQPETSTVLLPVDAAWPAAFHQHFVMQFAICLRILCSPPCLLASPRLQCNFSVFLKIQAQSWTQPTTDGWLHRRSSKDHCVSSWCICPPVRSIFRGKGSDEKMQSLRDIASLILSGRCSKVVVMSGAGISTPSGIPDFRSPGSGLYDNLQQYDVPYPEAIFDIGYFAHNPEPFFAVARQLYPGHCKPNYTHYFVRLLHQKGLLLRMYTQNIDGLERRAGIPPEKLVEAHGTFSTATCTICRGSFTWEQLQVEPFASLSEMVRNSVPRILINQDLVGSLTRNPLRSKDVVELGDVVRGVKRLSDLLGWTDQVNQLLSGEQSEM